MEKSAPMAGFTSHTNTTAKRLADIEARVHSWDWRQEVAADRTATGSGSSGRASTSRSPLTRLGQTQRVRAAVAAGIMVLLAAIGGIVWATTGSQHPATVPGHSIAATQFQVADREATTAGIRLANGFSNLKGLPTITAVSQFADPYTSAIGGYLGQLDRITWSPSEAAASQTLRNQVRAFISFLHTIHTISPVGLGAWIKELYAHVASMTGAAGHLRHDLGLPIAPTG